MLKVKDCYKPSACENENCCVVVVDTDFPAPRGDGQYARPMFQVILPAGCYDEARHKALDRYVFNDQRPAADSFEAETAKAMEVVR